MLQITNGLSVIHSFESGAIPGEYLTWADVLHDGPVPLTETLEQLSDIRARALAEVNSGSEVRIRRNLARRDTTLRAHGSHDEVVLWFEHDLFDQLQLLQLLDFFSKEPERLLTIIQIDRHPEVQPFQGLGQLTGPQLAALFPTRVPVTRETLDAGNRAWHAFRSPEPGELVSIAHQDLPGLPFLRAALIRHLEEYPWTRDGLSRIERQLLEAAAEGHTQRHSLYLESQRSEPCRWGDGSVFWRLDKLMAGGKPALTHSFELTDLGRRLLDGSADWIRARGGVDTWLGGVHLTGSDAAWRWNAEKKQLDMVSAADS